ncbi:MAG TPA: UDP-glucose 4-epimerase GalE [Pirellulaceae bacterium]|nr:UDP-glucose 4-epimerase GalE [Pirellulaceae bacterium]
MNVLVVGGAGYIGSHMVRLLDQAGHRVHVLDNLTTGFREAITAGEFHFGEMDDAKLVQAILADHRIDAVMHFAACALVNESVTDPAKYYRNNIVATLSLLESMRAVGVQRIVFSSTCATYGTPQAVPITESERQLPVNPYGFTKLVIERAMADYAAAYGFAFAALRYFNAAGASPAGDIGEDHDPESHLIPIVLQVALGQRAQVTIYGDDWPTPDGTCVRDYIHVDDLGRAHLAALERLVLGQGIEVNLGTGRGHSVREVIDVCREITGHEIPAVIGPRRAGDPAELVANAQLAKQRLGWTPQIPELRDIVETAWRWHASHPHGYRSKSVSATAR